MLIDLPGNNWEPRDYQLPLWSYLEHGGKRAIAVWHRRSGKDDVGLHRTAIAMHERIGTYWYLLPEAEQARKSMWNAVNPKTGMRRIDEAFPSGMRSKINDNEMFIRAKCGSTWQVVGSDNYDSLVGSPPIGVVFSEWALSKPQAWAYLRPIFAENDGWAFFNCTPRGKNHAKKMLDGAKGDPNWFTEVLPANKTGVFTKDQLAREKAELIREYDEAVGTAMFMQEYMCSFEAAVPGAIYTGELALARQEGRITRVPYDANLPVQTFWDKGFGDATAITFVQLARGGEVRVIDYEEDVRKTWGHYCTVLQGKQYSYGQHVLPHDANAGEGGTGKSMFEIVGGLLGKSLCVLGPRLDIEDRIKAARAVFPRCVFDEGKCEDLLDALINYKRVYVKGTDTLTTPQHDWTSHGSDSFGYMGLSLKERFGERKKVDMNPAKRIGAEQGWMR